MRCFTRLFQTGLLLTLLFGLCSGAATAENRNAAAPQRELYRVTWLRAAPGKLLSLIEVLRGQHNAAAVPRNLAPLILRHSQGDQWDLMVIVPVGSYAKYFSAERLDSSKTAPPETPLTAAGSNDQRQSLISWQEDEFMWGPPSAELRAALAPAALFHAEIFLSLPGTLKNLIAEREAENRYQRELSRPEGFIFTRDLGAAWDVMTIAPYQSWKHFAQRDDIPAEKSQAAARAAGFKSSDDIGPYLRSLIAMHHDTIGTVVP